MDWLIPTEQLGEHLLVAVIAFLVTALVVVIHYEGVHWLARRYAGRAPRRDRTAMLRIIFALLALHIVEIWCYGLTYWGLTKIPDAGFVHGMYGMQGATNLFDAVYLSAITSARWGSATSLRSAQSVWYRAWNR